MKNLVTLPILFAILSIYGCRSHKMAEVSYYSVQDSCAVQTDLNVHSFSNVEKNESIDFHFTQDHLEFSGGSGEIRIHPNGEVSIKGIKSADIMSNDTHKQSTTTATVTDNLIAKSYTNSAMKTAAETKTKSSIPKTSSIWLIVILFMILVILLIRIRRSR